MKVSQRVSGGFAIVVSLAALIYAVGFYGFSNIESRMEKITLVTEPIRQDAEALQQNLAVAFISTLEFSRNQKSEELEKYERNFNDSVKAINVALKSISERSKETAVIDKLRLQVAEKNEKCTGAIVNLFQAHRNEIKLNQTVQQLNKNFGDDQDVFAVVMSGNKTLDDDLKKSLKTSSGYIASLVASALTKNSAIELASVEKNIHTLFDQMESSIAGEEKVLRAFDKMKQEVLGQKGLLASCVELIEQRKQAEITLQEVETANQDLDALIAQLTHETTELASDHLRSAGKIVSKSRTILSGFAVAVLMTSLLISFLVIKSILLPLNSVKRAVEQVAGRNLRVNIDVNSADELGDLARSMRHLIKELVTAFSEMNAGSDQLAAAAEQFSTTSELSAKNVVQQLGETQSFAAAINEMSASIQEIAGNANNALAMADSASRQGSEGQLAMQLHVKSTDALAKNIEKAGVSVEQLSEVSYKIGSILDVIRSIAEQTNLLALNAAIEAARAGEQGRGFAVVADEVRTLASRTGASTTEIQSMIEKLQLSIREAVTEMVKSRQSTQAGLGEVTQANEMLTKMTDSIESIRDIAMSVASATEEQSTVASSLSESVSVISQLAEQNEHASAETLTVSRSLARLAEAQRALVLRFNI